MGKWMGKLIYKTERVIDVANKLMVTKGKSVGEINWEIENDIYILLLMHIK